MYSEHRLVHCDCERFYSVVADVQHYPQFVPGWIDVRVYPREEGRLEVAQYLRIGPARRWIRSLAFLEPPHRIRVRPMEPGAAGLDLEWRFSRAEAGCRVSLEVRGRATSLLLAMALDAVAAHAGQRFVDVFAARARLRDGLPYRPEPRT